MEREMIKKPQKNVHIASQFTILLLILVIFSGCTRNIPSNNLSSPEVTEKQVGQLVKKAEIQLDHLSNKCMPECLEKKQKILDILDVIEDAVGELNLDSSAIEMDDFLYTASGIREEIEYIGYFSDSKGKTNDSIAKLKSQFQELQANIDEVYLVAEGRSERDNKFSFKKTIMGFVIQRKMGMLAKDDFGL